MTWSDKRGAKHQSWVDMQNANRVIEEEDRKEGRLHDKLDMVGRASIIDAQLRATEAAIGLERLQIEKAVLLKMHPDIYSERYPEEWDEHLKKTDYDGQWKQLHCHDLWKEENEDKWEEEFPKLAEQEREKLKTQDYHGAWKEICYEKWCSENPKEAGMEAEIRQQKANLLWKSLNYQKWCEQNPEEARNELEQRRRQKVHEMHMELRKKRDDLLGSLLYVPGFGGLLIFMCYLYGDSLTINPSVLAAVFFIAWCWHFACFCDANHKLNSFSKLNRQWLSL